VCAFVWADSPPHTKGKIFGPETDSDSEQYDECIVKNDDISGSAVGSSKKVSNTTAVYLPANTTSHLQIRPAMFSCWMEVSLLISKQNFEGYSFGGSLLCWTVV
jgi:hypothetical protein